MLEEKGVENRIYHAGLALSERKATHKAFVYDEVQVLLVSHLLTNSKNFVQCSFLVKAQ